MRRLAGIVPAAALLALLGSTANATTPASAQAACLADPEPVTNILYYCDCQNQGLAGGASAACVAGSNSNAGTSKSLPKQTWATALSRFNSMAAGNAVALCDGGAWSVTGFVATKNTNCSASNRCVMRDYTPPWGTQIRGGDGIPIVKDSGSSGYILYFVGQQTPITHDEGYLVENIDFEGGGGGDGALLARGITDVTFCNVTFNNFSNGWELANSDGNASPINTTVSRNARVTFQGCHFTNNPSEGALGCAEDLHVNYNFWDHNSSSGLSHHMYFTQCTDHVPGNSNIFAEAIYYPTGEQFIGNVLTNAHSTGVSQCTQSMLTMHGGNNGAIIGGNSFVNASGEVGGGCFGIDINNGDPYIERFDNLSITGNTLVGFGNAGIRVNSCPSCSVTNNLLIGFAASGVTPVMIASGQSGLDAGEPGNSAILFESNTLYLATGITGATGIYVGDEGNNGTGYVLANNAFRTVSSSNTFMQLPISGSSYAAYSVIDYNAASQATGTPTWVSGVGNYSAWNTATGRDGHSKTTDPMFTSPGTSGYDFRPATGSPIIAAGNLTYTPTTDFNGVTRPNPPAIGAFEPAGTGGSGGAGGAGGSGGSGGAGGTPALSVGKASIFPMGCGF